MSMTKSESLEKVNELHSKIVRNSFAENVTESEMLAFIECEKALEKQIPKKPNLEGDGYADGHLVYDTWICPCCEKHYEVDYDDYDYCPNCGQAIDWSDK